MPRARRPCAAAGCPELVAAPATRCPACTAAQEAVYRRRRDPARNNAYSTKGHRQFRRRVLDRDPLCVICGAIATDADHYPRSRDQIVADGDNPNDPRFGRGLCHSCHSKQTAIHQPGGWNRR